MTGTPVSDSDLADNMRRLFHRNWPLDALVQRFSATYHHALELINQGRSNDFPAIWRAVYRYASMTENAEAALAIIHGHWDLVPVRDQFRIHEEHFSRTGAADELEGMYNEAVLAAPTRNIAYSGLIQLYCRSGQLETAKETVIRAKNDNLRGFLPNLMNFSQLLGMWDCYAETLTQAAQVGLLDETNHFRRAQILDWAQSESDPVFPYLHRFVNLTRERGRKLSLENRYKQIGQTPNFFAATDGSKLTETEYLEWCPTSKLHYGGVANLISQFGVWKEFLDSDADHLIVFEDDAWPFADLASWSDLKEVVNTQDPEIVFINERGAGAWWNRDLTKPAVSYATALAGFSDTMRAPGLDGYLVSRTGAAKLVENFLTDRVLFNIDWQIAAYAIDSAELDGLPEGIQKRVIGRIHHQKTSQSSLRSFSLNRPVVCQFAAGHATVHTTNMIVANSNR